MKKLTLLALLIAVSGSAFADKVTACKTLKNSTTEDMALAKERFRVGEVTISDVKTAELAALNAQLTCGEITINDYCKVAPTTAQEAIDGIKQELLVGSRTQGELSNARKELYHVQLNCP